MTMNDDAAAADAYVEFIDTPRTFAGTSVKRMPLGCPGNREESDRVACVTSAMAAEMPKAVDAWSTFLRARSAVTSNSKRRRPFRTVSTLA